MKKQWNNTCLNEEEKRRIIRGYTDCCGWIIKEIDTMMTEEEKAKTTATDIWITACNEGVESRMLEAFTNHYLENRLWPFLWKSPFFGSDWCLQQSEAF